MDIKEVLEKMDDWIEDCTEIAFPDNPHLLELRDVRDAVAELAKEVERLKGSKFSDRNTAALLDRAQTAEADRDAALRRVGELEGIIRDLHERFVRTKT